MALTCTKISAGATIDCANPPVPGLKDFAYLINSDDITSFSEDASGFISAINLASGGVQAYKFEVGSNSLNSLFNQVPAGVINAFAHQLTLIYPEDDTAAIEELTKLANGNVVAIVNKRGSDGNGTFRVLGKAQGLVSISIEGDDSNSERSGLPFVTLGTDPNFYEPKPPVHFLATDYDGSLAALEALLTPTA